MVASVTGASMTKAAFVVMVAMTMGAFMCMAE